MKITKEQLLQALDDMKEGLPISEEMREAVLEHDEVERKRRIITFVRYALTAAFEKEHIGRGKVTEGFEVRDWLHGQNDQRAFALHIADSAAKFSLSGAVNRTYPNFMSDLYLSLFDFHNNFPDVS